MKDLVEEWKDIKNYEGLYQVSNLGNVRSLDRFIINKIVKGKILKKCLTKFGYYRVVLSKNNVQITRTVHRLVAEAFIENTNNLPCVNHKDEDKTNNCVDNLEWCSYKYNNNYGTMQKRGHEKLSKPVLMLDLQGNVIQEFCSISEAFRITNILHIGEVCRGGRCSAGGYKWNFK